MKFNENALIFCYESRRGKGVVGHVRLAKAQTSLRISTCCLCMISLLVQPIVDCCIEVEQLIRLTFNFTG